MKFLNKIIGLLLVCHFNIGWGSIDVIIDDYRLANKINNSAYSFYLEKEENDQFKIKDGKSFLGQNFQSERKHQLNHKIEDCKKYRFAFELKEGVANPKLSINLSSSEGSVHVKISSMGILTINFLPKRNGWIFASDLNDFLM